MTSSTTAWLRGAAVSGRPYAAPDQRATRRSSPGCAASACWTPRGTGTRAGPRTYPISAWTQSVKRGDHRTRQITGLEKPTWRAVQLTGPAPGPAGVVVPRPASAAVAGAPATGGKPTASDAGGDPGVLPQRRGGIWLPAAQPEATGRAHAWRPTCADQVLPHPGRGRRAPRNQRLWVAPLTAARQYRCSRSACCVIACCGFPPSWSGAPRLLRLVRPRPRPVERRTRRSSRRCSAPNQISAGADQLQLATSTGGKRRRLKFITPLDLQYCDRGMSTATYSRPGSRCPGRRDPAAGQPVASTHTATWCPHLPCGARASPVTTLRGSASGRRSGTASTQPYHLGAQEPLRRHR